MSSGDYNKGQEHRYYGYGMYQGDYDYRRGYNAMDEQLHREDDEQYEKQQYERHMEELMIEEEMQRLMKEEQEQAELNEFIEAINNAINN